MAVILERASREGMPVTLEASEGGGNLYEKLRFELVDSDESEGC